MPNYNLNSLGPAEFERFAQSLIKAVIGDGTITFGAGPDGNREATFTGHAPYPSPAERWTGGWIFQAKYHDLDLLGPDKARKRLLADLDTELDAISQTRPSECDNYILITNVPLTSVAGSGTHDGIRNIADSYAEIISNVHVWGYDDVCRFLDVHAAVRQAYAHFLTAGDVIARLLRRETLGELDGIDEIIRLYIATDYHNERFAQLDQAGDVGDESLPLAKVFIDLDVVLEDRHNKDSLEGHSLSPSIARSLRDADDGTPATPLILGEILHRVVLIGGPGQGKSTLGQFTAQVHRAALLGKLPDVIGSDDNLIPRVPRIPFRIILREYAQWVARAQDDDTTDATHGPLTTVESYIAERVGRLASREASVQPEHIQTVLKSNPTLLIFDGLDEVVDLELRSKVLTEMTEFLERATSALSADMQIIGSSRPTGYAGEFHSAEFLHLRLRKLSVARANEYVAKWITARSLDEARESRVKTGFAESSEDAQVKLLLTTPLQVSIVIYVILAGGRPSRQRESLFTDYVDVIYKRERAKHRSIVTTEKDVLIGLHQYLGYLVHMRAGQATHVRSALTEDEFRSEVETFLRHNDPYRNADEMARQVETLVREARDRLVLIVEATPGYFGFELRSLQEYFAASHLVETAADSDQRYERFAAIATSIHWRNAALFFAGRVGRAARGEGAQLLDACRATDREEPDTYLRRGALLARDLALDRAFGPNNRLQRRAIEESIAIIESDPAAWETGELGQELNALSIDDITDHVLPTLGAKVEALDVTHQLKALEVYGQLPRSDGPQDLVRRFEDGDLDELLKALKVLLPQRWPVQAIERALTRCLREAEPGQVGDLVGSTATRHPTYVAAVMAATGVSDHQVRAIVDAALGDSVFHYRHDRAGDLRGWQAWQPPADEKAWLLGQVLILGSMVQGLGLWLDPHAGGGVETEVAKTLDSLDDAKPPQLGTRDAEDVRQLLRDACVRLMWCGEAMPAADLVPLCRRLTGRRAVLRSVWIAAVRTGHPASLLYEALLDDHVDLAQPASLSDSYRSQDSREQWEAILRGLHDESSELQRLALRIGDRGLFGDQAGEWEARIGTTLSVAGPLISLDMRHSTTSDVDRLKVLTKLTADVEVDPGGAAQRFTRVFASTDGVMWAQNEASRDAMLSFVESVVASPPNTQHRRHAAIAGLVTVVATTDFPTERVLAVLRTLGKDGENETEEEFWVPSAEPHRTTAKLAGMTGRAEGGSDPLYLGLAATIIPLSASVGHFDSDAGGELPIGELIPFLASDDPRMTRAGITLLPNLGGSDCAAGIAASLPHLGQGDCKSLLGFWTRSTRLMRVPGNEGQRTELLRVLAGALGRDEMPREFRAPSYRYMRRVADALEPAISSREEGLGLPLRVEK
ncbi:MAG TPA: hypothetical protein VEX36_03050 [Thermoleophilaceae bacterium]|nr:hypothetical protein [Thermoleophilaceae bacterium]